MKKLYVLLLPALLSMRSMFSMDRPQAHDTLSRIDRDLKQVEDVLRTPDQPPLSSLLKSGNPPTIITAPEKVKAKTAKRAKKSQHFGQTASLLTTQKKTNAEWEVLLANLAQEQETLGRSCSTLQDQSSHLNNQLLEAQHEMGRLNNNLTRHRERNINAMHELHAQLRIANDTCAQLRKRCADQQADIALAKSICHTAIVPLVTQAFKAGEDSWNEHLNKQTIRINDLKNRFLQLQEQITYLTQAKDSLQVKYSALQQTNYSQQDEISRHQTEQQKNQKYLKCSLLFAGLTNFTWIAGLCLYNYRDRIPSISLPSTPILYSALCGLAAGIALNAAETCVYRWWHTKTLSRPNPIRA